MDTMPLALLSVLAKARLKKIPKGQIILYEGDATKDVLIVKSGIIKIYDINNLGNEKILHLIKKPALIPFAFFSGSSTPTSWFYAAVTECEVFVLPYEDLQKAVRNNSGLAVYLMNWFSKEMHELLRRMSSMSKSNVRDKLMAALQFLASSHSEKPRGDWCKVQFPVNHQLLADMVGITRESASTVMKELQTEHVIRNPSQMILEINLTKLGDS